MAKRKASTNMRKAGAGADELSGSSKNSYHVKGKAMDFCVRGVSGAKLLAYVKTLPIHYAYQIGNSYFVHMDVT